MHINFPRLAVKVINVTGPLFGDCCTHPTQPVFGVTHAIQAIDNEVRADQMGGGGKRGNFPWAPDLKEAPKAR